MTHSFMGIDFSIKIGHTLLLRRNTYGGHVLVDLPSPILEVCLLGISPSGQSLKRRGVNGNTFWVGLNDYEIFEDLGEQKDGR